LFYFLSAYSAYTYFDGLGIRVLVDYYSVFALLGAKLFMNLESEKLLFIGILAIALFFSAMSLLYSYQSKKDILLQSGMTRKQWQYVFLKTDKSYQNVLGGSNDLTPYSKEKVKPVLEKNAEAIPFDYTQKDFGVVIPFDSIGFASNRLLVKINVVRKEDFTNASKDAMICIALEDKQKQNKAYTQYTLNEIPASDCCDE